MSKQVRAISLLQIAFIASFFAVVEPAQAAPRRSSPSATPTGTPVPERREAPLPICDVGKAIEIAAQQMITLLNSLIYMGQREVISRLSLSCEPGQAVSRAEVRAAIFKIAKAEHPVACNSFNIFARGKVQDLVDQKLDEVMLAMAGSKGAQHFICPPAPETSPKPQE